jgi:parallel beta-helix repeat protein
MDKRCGILIVSVTISVLCFVGTASATNWSVDGSGGADFTGIQDAINNASVGDTIIVYSGVYYENVVVNKSVTLMGNGYPVVDAGGEGDAIRLNADGITLVGFTATNSVSYFSAGIKVTSNNNTITGNNVRNYNWHGIQLEDSSNNIITDNNVDNNVNGILLSSSNNNTIVGNTFVKDGLYFAYGISCQNIVENNTVNGKPLVYLEDVSDYKVEDAGQVILVNCNNITVENLVLSNTSVGVELLETRNSRISNNTVCNNWEGILLYDSRNNHITGNNVNNNDAGIYFGHISFDNIIAGNNVNNNDVGIYLKSGYNTITGNNVNNNRNHGIYLTNSNNNFIKGNDIFCNNYVGIYIGSISFNNNITGNNVNNNKHGIHFDYNSFDNIITGNVFVNDGLFFVYDISCQNIVENNTVNGKPLVYLEDVSDYKVEDAGQVILVNCNNITVENLVLSNTSVGVELLKTRNSRISNNTVCNNWNGIQLEDSSNNFITGNNVSNNNERGINLRDSSNNHITSNNVSNNNECGINLRDSSNNHIYLNNFINNTDNAHSYESTKIWNSPLEITYTYGGNAYTNYIGNYWSDYNGTDAEGDGIGNTPYSIDSKGDESDDYPLMKPFENYNIPTLDNVVI